MNGRSERIVKQYKRIKHSRRKEKKLQKIGKVTKPKTWLEQLGILLTA